MRAPIFYPLEPDKFTTTKLPPGAGCNFFFLIYPKSDMPGIVLNCFISTLVWLLSCYHLTAQVTNIGNRTLEMDINGSKLKIPYYANHFLEGSINEINAAIIVIHGTDRNADDYYYNMRAAANKLPKPS